MSTTLTAAPVAARPSTDSRSVLTALRADCVRERAAALAESATSVPDAVAVSRAGRLLVTIAEIDAALARIDEGSYGRCERCGVQISAERLAVRPFAAACVSCEERTR